MEDENDTYLNHEIDGDYLSVCFVGKQGGSYKVMYSGCGVEDSCQALDSISGDLITNSLVFRLVSGDFSALPYDKLKGVETFDELDKWLKLFKVF